jgi:hypothetical protein
MKISAKMMLYLILCLILIIDQRVYSWLGAHKKLFVRIAHLYSQTSQPPFFQADGEVNENTGSNRKYILSNSLFSTDKSGSSSKREFTSEGLVEHSFIDSIDTSSLQPDRINYMKFFESLSTKKKKIDLSSLYAHDDVRMLLEGQMIDEALIQDRWTEKVIQNIVNKKPSKNKSPSDQKTISRKDMSLNEQDSYDVLCSVMNLGTKSTTASANMTLDEVINIDSKDTSKPSKQPPVAAAEKPVKEKTKKTTERKSTRENSPVKASSFGDDDNGDDGNNNNNNQNNYSQDEPLGEDLRYLEQQFQALAANNPKSEISWNTFIHWEEIAALLHDGYCEVEDVRKAWKEVVGSFTRSLDLKKFIEINRVLDGLVDSESGIDDDLDDFSPIDEQSIEFKDGQFTKSPTDSAREQDLIVDDGSFDMSSDMDSDVDVDSEAVAGMITSLEDLDPWDPSLDPKQVFDDEFIFYLKDFFDSHALKSGAMAGLLVYDKFCSWSDMKQLMKEGQMDMNCLKDLWMEALMEYQSKRSVAANNGKASTRRASLQDGMDLDTFLRMNIRLDMMLDEIEEALANLSDAEVEGYYRKVGASSLSL